MSRKRQKPRKRIRPQGEPCEILHLKNGQYIGAYGVKNTGRGWYRLVAFNPVKWISADEIKTVLAWSETAKEYLKINK